MSTPDGYFTSDDQFVDSKNVILHPSATRTADGDGSVVFETGQRRTLTLGLEVTAASGTTPTLDVSVETSLDGVDWFTHGAFAQMTATGDQAKSFGGLSRFARVSWAITGTTPSFTFSVRGEAA